MGSKQLKGVIVEVEAPMKDLCRQTGGSVALFPESKWMECKNLGENELGVNNQSW